MEAYLDNSATTRVLDSVKDLMVTIMTEDYGNPSSMHRKGMEAERYVREARENIARTLKVQDKEIIFTSGFLQWSGQPEAPGIYIPYSDQK